MFDIPLDLPISSTIIDSLLSTTTGPNRMTGPHTALPLIDRYQPIAVNLRDLRRDRTNQSFYKPSFDETPSISSYNSTGYTLIHRDIRRDTPDCERPLLLAIFTAPFRYSTRTIILDLIRLTERLYKCRHFEIHFRSRRLVVEERSSVNIAFISTKSYTLNTSTSGEVIHLREARSARLRTQLTAPSIASTHPLSTTPSA